MRYRSYPRGQQPISVLAMGTQGLEESHDPVEHIRAAINSGINFLDLGQGLDTLSRDRVLRAFGTALAEGLRNQVQLALHLPAGLFTRYLDFTAFIERNLNLLETDRVDFLILDGLNRDTWQAFLKADLREKIQAAIDVQLIHALGFRFRDQLQVLREILDAGLDWRLCQFDYSFMDAEHYPGLGGLRLAHERSLAVMVVDPLKRGRLGHPPPGADTGYWEALVAPHRLADWGLRWVLQHEEVTSVILNKDDLAEMPWVIAQADSIEAGSTSVREQLLINRLRDAYRKLKPIPCNACRTCMPCPEEIDVPRILELYNDAIMYDDPETARDIYREEQHQLEDCNECGACVSHCGKMIAILETLKKAQDLFEPQ